MALSADTFFQITVGEIEAFCGQHPIFKAGLPGCLRSDADAEWVALQSDCDVLRQDSTKTMADRICRVSFGFCPTSMGTCCRLRFSSSRFFTSHRSSLSSDDDCSCSFPMYRRAMFPSSRRGGRRKIPSNGITSEAPSMVAVLAGCIDCCKLRAPSVHFARGPGSSLLSYRKQKKTRTRRESNQDHGRPNLSSILSRAGPLRIHPIISDVSA